MSLEKYLQTRKKSHLIFDLDQTIFNLRFDWEKYLEGIKGQLMQIDRTIFAEFVNKKMTINETENKYVITYGTKVRQLLLKRKLYFEMNDLQGVEVNEELVAFIKHNSNY